ncbi:MAG: hypothetical protein RL748_3975 [Pseudomonadota bacterium]|jgi:hypothetical protein
MKKLLVSSLMMLMGLALVPAHANPTAQAGAASAPKLALEVNDQTSFAIVVQDAKKQPSHTYHNLSAEQAFNVIKNSKKHPNMVWLQGPGEKSYFTTDATIIAKAQQLQAEMGQLQDEMVGGNLTTKLKPENKAKIKALIQQALAQGVMAQM